MIDHSISAVRQLRACSKESRVAVLDELTDIAQGWAKSKEESTLEDGRTLQAVIELVRFFEAE